MTSQSPTEWNAKVYHRVSNPHVTWGARVLNRLALNGDETAIDAGCGTGRLMEELLERLPRGRVIAVDRSRNMLDEARATLGPRYGDRVSFVQSDLLDLTPDVIGQPVDLVFSTATFHWIRDHERLFPTLFDLLVPGGWLAAQCGGGPNLAGLLERTDALMASAEFAPYFEGWDGPWEFADPETTANRLRQAGFADIETSLEAAPTELPDRETFRDFLANVIFGSHLARLPDDALRERFVERLVEQSAQDEPPYFLDYWRLNMKGRRPA